MAVSVTNDFNLTPADGASTRFYFPFQVENESDILVHTLLDDVVTPVFNGITKTINIGNIGGYVDFSVAPLVAAGDVLIRRRTPNTQPTEITDFTRYKESAIMRAMDNIVFQVQQHASILSRIPAFLEKNTINDAIIEAPQDGKLLQFSGTNGRIVNGIDGASIAADIANISVFAAQVTADKNTVAADKAIVAADKAATEVYKDSAEAASNSAASILAQGIYTDVITLTVADSPFTPLVAADGVCYALDMTGGAITINLSELSTYSQNMRFGFVKVDSSGNAATINRGGSSDTINGSTSATVTTQHTVNSLFGVESTGTWVLAAQTTAIPDGSIANAKLANMAQATIKGKPSASGTGAPVDLTPAQARTILDVYTKAEANAIIGGGAAPTVQILTSGTTYTTPANCTRIVVEMVGGGGGGGGNNTGGNNGGSTSFNSIAANGGGAGTNGVQTVGGLGGTGGTGTALLRIPGNGGGIGGEGSSAAYGRGGHGGASFFGGGTPGQGQNSATAAAANTGAGGAGSQGGTLAFGGPGASGGGAGEYAMFIISSPASSYTYAIGAGGAGGSLTGGAGGSGLIRVTEYY